MSTRQKWPDNVNKDFNGKSTKVLQYDSANLLICLLLPPYLKNEMQNHPRVFECVCVRERARVSERASELDTAVKLLFHCWLCKLR